MPLGKSTLGSCCPHVFPNWPILDAAEEDVEKHKIQRADCVAQENIFPDLCRLKHKLCLQLLAQCRAANSMSMPICGFLCPSGH